MTMEPSLSWLCGSQKAHAPFVSGGTRTGSVLPSGTTPFSCPTSRPVTYPVHHFTPRRPILPPSRPSPGEDRTRVPPASCSLCWEEGTGPQTHGSTWCEVCHQGMYLVTTSEALAECLPGAGGHTPVRTGQASRACSSLSDHIPLGPSKEQRPQNQASSQGPCPGPPGRARTQPGPSAVGAEEHLPGTELRFISLTAVSSCSSQVSPLSAHR